MLGTATDAAAAALLAYIFTLDPASLGSGRMGGDDRDCLHRTLTARHKQTRLSLDTVCLEARHNILLGLVSV